MTFPPRTFVLSALLPAALALAGCGPKQMDLDPRSAVDIQVRPASGQRLFCPGDRFQIELVAKLKDGTSCSSTDRSRGCLGEKDAVIKGSDVRLDGSAGALVDAEKFVWLPPAEPLETADTGLTLKGWLERTVEGQQQKSMIGEAELRPVYQCHMEAAFGSPPANAPGAAGADGPQVTIAVTSLSTPYYPAAALVRVESGGNRYYYISPSSDQAIRVTARGQDGAAGVPGAPGPKGEDGKAVPKDAPACAKGGTGKDGGDGGDGRIGGAGGMGGVIKIVLDAAAADKLTGRVLTSSPGGSGGFGGAPGPAGPGGAGGAGGPTTPDCPDNTGVPGKPGRAGRAGAPGPGGAAGPAPVITTAARDTLFAAEMPVITRIEAAKAKPAQ